MKGFYMDMPPPQETPVIQFIVKQNEITPEQDLYNRFILRRIYDKRIPRDVKIFARNHHCDYLMKRKDWEYEKWGTEVFHCKRNNRLKYLLYYDGKIKFASIKDLFYLRKLHCE